LITVQAGRIVAAASLSLQKTFVVVVAKLSYSDSNSRMLVMKALLHDVMLLAFVPLPLIPRSRPAVTKSTYISGMTFNS